MTTTTGTQSGAELSAERDVLNIPMHVMQQGIKGYSEQDQDDLLWLYGYMREETGSTKVAIRELLDCDYSTVWRVLTGGYGAKITRFMETVRRVRARVEAMAGAEFVRTIVTDKIWQTMDLARNSSAVVHICGGSGRSKTWTAKEWKRVNNHGRSIYVDCPVLGGTRVLLEELAKRAGVSVGRTTADIARRLEASFNWRQTIIIDEAVRLIPAGRTRNVKPLEFLRRLHDVCGCGIVFISTDVFRQEMEYGAISSFLEQLLGRIEDPLLIPEKVLRQEAADICRAFNPDADADDDLIGVAHQIANGRGKVRVLFSLIRQAAKLAEHKSEPLGARHLKAAVALRQNLHRWPEE